RKGRSLRKKPIRGVFRLQSQVFQNLLGSEKPHATCQKAIFDKLRRTGAFFVRGCEGAWW
ncbi:hypothetical protein, partial [Brotocaccenecus cirricatena]|uniref:hypothetical protein n=1 Tax=Brotocaccenecus cirricatena TaxID=3064195 RepID=UPI0032BFFA4A